MKTTGSILLIFIMTLSGCTATPEAETNPGPLEWVTYEGQNGPGQGKHIVLVSGDEEYRSEEALPQLAKILSERHGFNTTVLFAQDPAHPGIIDPNYTDNIPGLEALGTADLMVLFTRFRALPDDQMEHVQSYLMDGKPVVAFRTSTHAFQFRDSTSKWLHWSNSFNDETSPWNGGFGRLVLGEKWITHHGHHKHQSTRGLIASGAENHPITNGLEDGDIWGSTDVYGVRLPMQESVTPLVLGQVINRPGEFDENDLFFGMRSTDNEVATVNPATKTPYNPNDPLMPIAWTKSYQLPDGQPGQSFTSTIGASSDMLNEGVRRLMVNAVYHLLEMDVPAKADVAVVGTFEPTAYSFHDDAYFDSLNLKVSDHAQ